MASRVTTSVTYRPPRTVAAEVFSPGGKLYRDVWNKTQTVGRVARQLCPVRTGALKASIVARKANSWAPDRPVFEVAAGQGLRYAAPMELGFTHWKSHRWIEGHHFLATALRSVSW